MADRAMANPKIDFAWNSEVTAIHGTDKVTGITLRDTLTGQERQLDATGVFVAIGQDRKSTRLNSSHVASSYAVFCLKKKMNTPQRQGESTRDEAHVTHHDKHR